LLAVGAVTALMAATIGIVQRDFKKVLAYSTVSQLGFMFVGVGTGAYSAGMFHLMTHAFFKAGLFLGAGSVMHAMGGEGDITKMGGLGKHMPITRWTFFIYCLAIAGIVPFAGFFEGRDPGRGICLSSSRMSTRCSGPQSQLDRSIRRCCGRMLATAAAVYGVLHVAAVLRGVYRQVPWHERARASPARVAFAEMTLPLIVLAVGSVLAGLIGVPAR
jgi:NADH-quinone oxidoreductase subunit L